MDKTGRIFNCCDVISEKIETVVDIFARNYFGHVDPSLPSCGAWRELEELMESLDASLSHPKYSISSSERDRITMDIQRSFIDQIKSVHPSAEFPTNLAFNGKTQEWLKKLVNRLHWDENSHAIGELHEAREETETESNYAFKTYEIVEGCPVVLIEENSNKISHGTTGLISWQGAMTLTTWASEASLFQGKTPMTILELGSGVGLFAMTMAKAGHHFTATDFHPKVLNFLLANATINSQQPLDKKIDKHEWLSSGPPEIIRDPSAFDPVSFTPMKGTEAGSVTVRRLDWMNFRANHEKDKLLDVIVGSDLVYDLSVLPGLVHVIKELLIHNKEKETKAFIACTQRKEESIRKFLQLIEQHDLKHDVVFKRCFSPSECNMISHEPLHPVTLYCIALK